MDYRRYLERAIAIFNENMDTDFSIDNVVLGYLTAANQKQVFERFCVEHFPTVWMTAMRKRATSISMRRLSFLRNPEPKMAFSFIPIFHIHPQN